MAQQGEIFFTTIGCMDGRCQEAVWVFGKNKFYVQYPDTITEPGLVGILANNPSKEFLADLKAKIEISIDKHHSRGIVVYGHEDCAALSGVSDEVQKSYVQKAVKLLQSLIDSSISVVGIFVKRENGQWVTEELT